MQQHLLYEVARYEATLIINYTSTILKQRIDDQRKAFPFPWEKEQMALPQTQEELLKQGKALARAFGAVESGRPPGSPPMHLAPKFRK